MYTNLVVPPNTPDFLLLFLTRVIQCLASHCVAVPLLLLPQKLLGVLVRKDCISLAVSNAYLNLAEPLGWVRHNMHDNPLLNPYSMGTAAKHRKPLPLHSGSREVNLAQQSLAGVLHSGLLNVCLPAFRSPCCCVAISLI